MKRESAWTTTEEDLLADHYLVSTNSELAALFPGRSALAIYKKAYKMGLRKPPEIEFRNRSEARKGERGANWKGGVRKTTSGYKQILAPAHPRADSAGYVLEHIAVFEQATGISVPEGCCIHHLNGDKGDNRIENLCLMTHGAHTAFHHTGKTRSAETREKISIKRRARNVTQ